MNDKVFYVYQHVDPQTRDIVYVGKGKHGRAWDVTRCRNQHKEHQDWMKELCKFGYVPCDWVVIIEQGLSEEEAFLLEKEWLHSNGCPIYNRQSGEKQHQAKLTNTQAREIYTACELGEKTHKALAEEYGVSRSTISMIASGKQWRAITHDLRSNK